MTTVQEASAARQRAADRKNSLESELRALHAEERALNDQIGRLVADQADPKNLKALKIQRDKVRELIEDLEGAEQHVAADYATAEEVLKHAQRAERQATVTAAIAAARSGAERYTNALAEFLSARDNMRALAGALPGQEAAVQGLVDDVLSYRLHQTPSNHAYGSPFTALLEPYLERAAAQ